MNDAQKLLDNGWMILIHRNGLGTYEALAVPKGVSPTKALRQWRRHVGVDSFDGPNRYSGEGFTVELAMLACVEKTLFNRLPSAADQQPVDGEK